MKPVSTPPWSGPGFLFFIAVTAYFCLFSMSCVMVQRSDTPRVPKMGRESVVAAANKAAADAGYAISDYKQPEAYFELSARDSTWTVFFEERSPVGKGNFQVWIDDNTGRADVMTGE